jgi:pyruvate/2-oxoglutarate dehydrogenase complex dihydrolipoamide acyltransferase (E2) component
MPHDVIMPALGMAQETGVILSWLKKPGDQVSLGDALMEVETDKAVMEVESSAAGVLSDVKAAAGESVPVGQVVAVILDPEEVLSTQISPTEKPSGVAPHGATSTETIPANIDVTSQIVMPALGMAQETGRVIAWHKQVGEETDVDDILLEVETDKATMEVPAGKAGFVANLFVGAGQEVPVGSVIATLSNVKPSGIAAPQQPLPKPITVPAETPTSVAMSSVLKPRFIQPGSQTTDVVAGSGKILASPKARRLALENDLDLSLLAKAGYAQPYHVADLERFDDLPQLNTEKSVLGNNKRINAAIPVIGVESFLAKLREQADIEISDYLVWASFASAAWRNQNQTHAAVIVEVAELLTPIGIYENLDTQRLSRAVQCNTQNPPNFIIRTLSKSLITALHLDHSCPSITVQKTATDYLISFEFSANAMSDFAAVAFISDFAARLENPLRQLL